MQTVTIEHITQNWDGIKNLGVLRKDVKEYVTKVYSTLTACLLLAAVGSYAYTLFAIPRIISFICTFIGMLAIYGTPKTEQYSYIRLLSLFGFSFFQGAAIGPLINLVIAIDSEIIMTALLGTIVVFACFSLSAIFSDKRSTMFTGAIASTGLSLLCLTALLNIFFGSSFLYLVQLYGGLVVFCLYVMVDTQLMILRAESGHTDYIHDSLQLLIDFVAIFVRLLIILSRKAEDKKKRKTK